MSHHLESIEEQLAQGIWQERDLSLASPSEGNGKLSGRYV